MQYFKPLHTWRRFLSKFLILGIILLTFAWSDIFIFALGAENLTPSQEREQLEKELKALEEEMKKIEHDITKTQQEKNTLQSQISLLRSKIKKLDLQINQSTKIIADLRSQIADTTSSVEKTEETIKETKYRLGTVLRQIYQEDQKTTVEIVLSGPTLSDFFNNVAALQALHVRARELLEDFKELHGYLQGQKDTLESEKEEEQNFMKIQILQKQQSETLKHRTEQVLEVAKGKETEYQKTLEDKKKRAQEIRSRIFELIGVPEAPTFGEALEIAKLVSGQTGVRPALILAVLTQESNLGKNVGQCYLKDFQTGAGVKAFNGSAVAKVMKPSRDVHPFLEITKELGRDPSNTPVSCPILSVGGYGGAMGPAQFIPSTWMKYRQRISALISKTADPWNIKDAFLASALFLADAGAGTRDRNAEWRAAMIYFSGGANPRYRFYGDSVMAIATQYEEEIKILENGSLGVLGVSGQ